MTLESASFIGELTLRFNGKTLDFMGMEYQNPKFDVPLKYCQGCAMLIMNGQKGILVNG